MVLFFDKEPFQALSILTIVLIRVIVHCLNVGWISSLVIFYQHQGLMSPSCVSHLISVFFFSNFYCFPCTVPCLHLLIIFKEGRGRWTSSGSTLCDLLHSRILHFCLGREVHPHHWWVLVGRKNHLCSFSLAPKNPWFPAPTCCHTTPSSFCHPAPCLSSKFHSSMSVRLFPPCARILFNNLCCPPPPRPPPPCRHPCWPHPPRVPCHHWFPQSWECPHRLHWERGWRRRRRVEGKWPEQREGGRGGPRPTKESLRHLSPAWSASQPRLGSPRRRSSWPQIVSFEPAHWRSIESPGRKAILAWFRVE